MLGGWPGRVAGRVAGFTNYWCNSGCAKNSLSLSFLMFDARTNILFTFVMCFFFSLRTVYLPVTVSWSLSFRNAKKLQNGFEAGKSERQGNALVSEKPLIILNAVSTWTKLKKTTLQWQALIMQSKMLATNQTCLPDCWWNFLRIIEPQV